MMPSVRVTVTWRWCRALTTLLRWPASARTTYALAGAAALAEGAMAAPADRSRAAAAALAKARRLTRLAPRAFSPAAIRVPMTGSPLSPGGVPDVCCRRASRLLSADGDASTTNCGDRRDGLPVGGGPVHPFGSGSYPEAA